MSRIYIFILAALLLTKPAWAEVWGSSKSRVYHYKLCRWTAQIKPEYRLSFATPAAARKAGYQPCGTCRPPGVEAAPQSGSGRKNE